MNPVLSFSTLSVTSKPGSPLPSKRNARRLKSLSRTPPDATKANSKSSRKPFNTVVDTQLPSLHSKLAKQVSPRSRPRSTTPHRNSHNRSSYKRSSPRKSPRKKTKKKKKPRVTEKATSTRRSPQLADAIARIQSSSSSSSPFNASKRRDDDDVVGRQYGACSPRALQRIMQHSCPPEHKRRRMTPEPDSPSTPEPETEVDQVVDAFPDAPFICPSIFNQIMGYIPNYEKVGTMVSVCKRWKDMIFNCPAHWDLIVISNSRATPGAVSSRVGWLKTAPVKKYVLDVNIAYQMDVVQTRTLSQVELPNLREFSVDINNDCLAHSYYMQFLQNHQQLLWINGEFSTEDRTRAALIPLTCVPKLRCLGVERVYLSKFGKLQPHKNILALGHLRIFADDVLGQRNRMGEFLTSFPSLKALSISIDDPKKIYNATIAKCAKDSLEVLYIFENRPIPQNAEFLREVWLPLRNMNKLKQLMLVNLPRSWIRQLKRILPKKCKIYEVTNGLNFWTEAEAYVY